MKKLFYFFSISFLIFSCSSSDDSINGGEPQPSQVTMLGNWELDYMLRNDTIFRASDVCNANNEIPYVLNLGPGETPEQANDTVLLYESACTLGYATARVTNGQILFEGIDLFVNPCDEVPSPTCIISGTDFDEDLLKIFTNNEDIFNNAELPMEYSSLNHPSASDTLKFVNTDGDLVIYFRDI